MTAHFCRVSSKSPIAGLATRYPSGLHSHRNLDASRACYSFLCFQFLLIATLHLHPISKRNRRHNYYIRAGGKNFKEMEWIRPWHIVQQWHMNSPSKLGMSPRDFTTGTPRLSSEQAHRCHRFSQSRSTCIYGRTVMLEEVKREGTSVFIDLRARRSAFGKWMFPTLLSAYIYLFITLGFRDCSYQYGMNPGLHIFNGIFWWQGMSLPWFYYKARLDSRVNKRTDVTPL